jgi:hypothetical protein
MKNEEQITALVVRLRDFHAREERLGDTWLRWIEYPLRPKTGKGNVRINPILGLLVVMALFAGGTFLFFSFVKV